MTLIDEIKTNPNVRKILGKREIESKEVGERVINNLKDWDEVAYVRFASVYRQFKDINEFMAELEGILKSRREKENH